MGRTLREPLVQSAHSTEGKLRSKEGKQFGQGHTGVRGRASTHPQGSCRCPFWHTGPDWQRHPQEGTGLIRAPRQTAGGRHMHLVLGPSCPPLQPPNWGKPGGVGTGGGGKGVPRSPAGVDPKETPFITKHLAGKLRTRHDLRLVTKRRVRRA